MKRHCILLLLITSLFSCTTADLSETPEETSVNPVVSVEETSDGETIDVYQFPAGLFPTEEISVPLKDLYQLPKINSDLLPGNALLRLVELKRRYFRFDTLDISPFRENTVTSLFTSENGIFTGTLRGGVFKSGREGNSPGVMILKPFDSISNRAITAITGSNKHIYISSYSGLYVYNETDAALTDISSLTGGKTVLSMEPSDEGLYLGTTDGCLLLLKNNKIREILNVNSSIRSIEIAGDNAVIGSGNGNIVQLDRYTGASEILCRTKGRINDLLYTEDALYIADDSGLMKYEYREEILTVLFSENRFLSIGESGKYIYFGTHSTGLFIYDKIHGNYKSWDLETGLPVREITALSGRDDEIVIGFPEKGLLIIDEEIHEKL